VLRKDGDDYVITGQKMWITNSLQADWMCLLANTSEGAGHKNKSLIVVPMATPGISKAKKIRKIGMMSSDTGLIHFDGQDMGGGPAPRNGRQHMERGDALSPFERDVAHRQCQRSQRLHKMELEFPLPLGLSRRGMINDFQKIDSVEGRMVAHHLTTQLVATGIRHALPPCTKVPTTRAPVCLITYCTVTRNVESTTSTCTDSTRIHSLSQRCSELCTSI